MTAYNILINAKAGTVLAMGIPALKDAFTLSGIEIAELCLCAPKDMAETLKRLCESDTPLLVGGGDGTIRETAKALSQGQKAFGILPFGTMNLLAKDLGLVSLTQALDAYARGSFEDAIDAAYVNGEIFMCAASIGPMPKASKLRENNRKTSKFLLLPKLFFYIIEQFEKYKRQKIILKLDGDIRRFRASAVVVSNNRFSRTANWLEHNFKRETLKGGLLAVYAAETKTHFGHLKFLFRLMLGNWLNDPSLSEFIGRSATLSTRRKKEWVSLDGEVFRMMRPLRFSLKPESIRILVPAEDPSL
jgi:diacylglycerol kinase family enzyme